MAIAHVFRFLLLIAFVLISGCVPPPEYLAKTGKRIGLDNDYIKVLLLRDQLKVEIVTTAKTKVTKLQNNAIVYNGDAKRFVVFDNQLSQALQFESWNNEIQVNGISVRGMIQLYPVVGKIQVVNVLKMNEYLYGVLPSEIMPGWPMEVLKAQAVAARTYAYYHLMKTGSTYFDLYGTHNFQVYKGKTVETQATNKAVDTTAGIIMTYNNKPILAYFHSTCGGKTTDDRYVWQGEDLPYLNSVVCPYCKNSPNYSWQVELTLNEIYEALVKRYKAVGKIKAITLGREDTRVTVVKIEHENGLIRMSGNDFRLMFEAKKIKSLYFEAKQTPTGLMLTGHGWGHGVGMCQWGAKEMAQQGMRFDQILTYYYRGIQIVAYNGPR
ncbi:MAG: SpoIID/LytB domain-containing protein [Spirochaetes bacterium]|nr:SpoIID/LytB domain-containing protein [Spirochaetota bacterium]